MYLKFSIWPHCIPMGKSIWNLLTDSIQMHLGPWLALNDFNLITSQHDKRGGTLFSSGFSGGLQNFINSNKLIDLNFSGNQYTWTNGWIGKENIKKWLDYVIANQTCPNLSPNAVVLHVPTTSLDHNPILLYTMGKDLSLLKPYKFEKF